MYTEKKFCFLSFEFGQLDVFKRLLNLNHKRVQLLKCYQALIEHESNAPIELINNYVSNKLKSYVDDNIIDLGLKLGAFLSEGGWYCSAIDVLDAVEDMLNNKDVNVKYLCKLLDCYHK